jgi:raffinose/stachyose/melibiose transport system permease protein
MALATAVRVDAETKTQPKRRRYRAFAQTVWWFVLPAAAIYLFAVVYPSVRGILYAFTDWDGVSPDPQWVGLEQFAHIWTDPAGLTAIKNTVVIALALTVGQNLIGLLLALAVNTRIKTRNVLRVVLFAPVVITSIAVGFLWKNLYAPTGAINEALSAVGLGALRQNWLGDPNVAIWAVVIVVFWQLVGYSMVIFLAGLQGIPQEILEAAAIDGAGPVRRFWSVVRPLLAPAITINVMLSFIGGLKLFDQVQAMTGGGPGGATATISTVIYANAFSLGRFAYGAALALLLTIFVAIASVIQYRLLTRKEG